MDVQLQPVKMQKKEKAVADQVSIVIVVNEGVEKVRYKANLVLL